MKIAVYPAALLAVAIATVATMALQPWMGASPSLFFFPAIFIVAMYAGYGPALFATVLSTASLAYFFVPPVYSLNVGADDAIRLSVFVAVAMGTAWLSATRKRAEDTQQRTLEDLQAALTTLRKVSGWPTFAALSISRGSREVLAHAAAVLECGHAVAAWEVEDEPWIYVADSSRLSDRVTRLAPADAANSSSHEDPQTATLTCHIPGGGLADASAPFEFPHVKGRIFFVGLPVADQRVLPLAEVVAHEAGTSLEQLYVQERFQQLAIREDRIRVARDLHDGVLQSLTGIRFRLQALTTLPDDATKISDHLLAIERAIAIEQRELRHFIEELKPVPLRADPGGLALALEELRNRLAVEWRALITVKVSPTDLALLPGVGEGVCLLVREATVNALKHAHPSRVSIEVQVTEDRTLHLLVTNDGRGFSFLGRFAHDELVASGVGPVSLRERVEEMGGMLSVESMATGSRVEIVLPEARRELQGDTIPSL
jgi:signal transduction histidine kinase